MWCNFTLRVVQLMAADAPAHRHHRRCLICALVLLSNLSNSGSYFVLTLTYVITKVVYYRSHACLHYFLFFSFLVTDPSTTDNFFYYFVIPFFFSFFLWPLFSGFFSSCAWFFRAVFSLCFIFIHFIQWKWYAISHTQGGLTVNWSQAGMKSFLAYLGAAAWQVISLGFKATTRNCFHFLWKGREACKQLKWFSSLKYFIASA